MYHHNDQPTKNDDDDDVDKEKRRFHSTRRRSIGSTNLMVIHYDRWPHSHSDLDLYVQHLTTINLLEKHFFLYLTNIKISLQLIISNINKLKTMIKIIDNNRRLLSIIYNLIFSFWHLFSPFDCWHKMLTNFIKIRFKRKDTINRMLVNKPNGMMGYKCIR